jgi:hypothetical protein
MFSCPFIISPISSLQVQSLLQKELLPAMVDRVKRRPYPASQVEGRTDEEETVTGANGLKVTGTTEESKMTPKPLSQGPTITRIAELLAGCTCLEAIQGLFQLSPTCSMLSRLFVVFFLVC